MTSSPEKQNSRTPTPILSIAPMLDVTDRHFRYFMRLLTKHTWLYSEMITANAIMHGDREKLLGFSASEHPLALQIAGDDPRQLAECARIGEDFGYDEINLNVGCPSDRVQKGSFGACLMARPDVVAAAVEAMSKATALPVTVKHRIGIDMLDRYQDLRHFVETVSAAGCDRFIVHARIALLNGKSPKENRKIPPLRYQDVYRLKKEFPHLFIVINGGITTLQSAAEHLQYVDGVMIGRATYENPYLFALADAVIFQEHGQPPSRREIIESYMSYMMEQAERGANIQAFKRPLMGLFVGQPRARFWRRILTENIRSTEQLARLQDFLTIFPDKVLDERPAIEQEGKEAEKNRNMRKSRP